MAGRAVGGKNCIAIQNCITTERLGSWAARRARRWALGWACSRRAAGAGPHGHSTGISGARGRARGGQGVRQASSQACAGRRWQALARAGSGTAWARAGSGTAWARRGARLGARIDAQGARHGRCLGAGWACWLGQLGQVGALCTWLSSDSVFRPGFTQYCS